MDSNEDFCNNIEKWSRSLILKMKIDNKAKNTLQTYQRTYKHFIEFCRQYDKELSFKNIKQNDIYEFIEYKSMTMQKQGNLSASTSNSIITHLKKLFTHIERNSNELYDFTKVFEDIKLTKPKRTAKGLTDKEIKKLTNYLESMKTVETFISFRNVLLIKFMLFGGTRASETTSITLNDIILDSKNGLYEISFFGKGNKQRKTYIAQNLIEDEIEMLKSGFQTDSSKPIAMTTQNKPMDRIQLWKMVKSIFTHADIKYSGVHTLRHTAAKQMLANKISIVVVQELLGHSSIQTTQIYANPTEDIIKRELTQTNIDILLTPKGGGF